MIRAVQKQNPVPCSVVSSICGDVEGGCLRSGPLEAEPETETLLQVIH